MTFLAVTGDIKAFVKRSARRRTIGIKVYDGKVQINAPRQVTLAEIQNFVGQKVEWIRRHLDRQMELKVNQLIPQYQTGEKIYFKGNVLNIITQKVGTTTLLGENLFINDSTLNRADRAIEIANWYLDQALEDLPERTSLWSRRMGLIPNSIKIRHYKTRWGSCDRKGGLQFNWLIMMAPEEVIDYVVVHELAHLAYFNHSNCFWSLVQSVLPNYACLRSWLRQQKHLVWQLEDVDEYHGNKTGI